MYHRSMRWVTKNNLDSYRRALWRLSAGVSTLVQLRASLGFERGREEHRIPDPAGGPADPGDVRRHLDGVKEGFSLLWLVAPFVCFLAPMFLFFNASALIYGVAYSLLGFAAHGLGVLVHSCCSQ